MPLLDYYLLGHKCFCIGISIDVVLIQTLSTLICLLIIGHCPLSPFLLISINFAPHWMLHLDFYLLGHKCFCIGSSKHCRHNGFWDRSSNRLYSCLCIMPDQLTKHCLEFFESRANNPDASAFSVLLPNQGPLKQMDGIASNEMLIF